MFYFLSSDSRLLGKSIQPFTKSHLSTAESIFDAVASLVKIDLREHSVSVPVYDFSFPSTGNSFHTLQKISTGAFNSYFYRKHSEWQTLDPIFAICGWGLPRQSQIYHGKQYSPFGSESIFEDHVKNSFTYISMGIGISEMATLMHYVESMNSHGPLYRYKKTFFGTHNIGNIGYQVSIDMHCRPKGLQLEYDVDRLNSDLLHDGVVNPYLNLEKWFSASARELFEYWNEKRKIDPLYFLSPNSRQEIDKKLQTLGRPFTLSDFE